VGFNRWLLTDLLRGQYGFKGLILSDWAITNECSDICRNGVPPKSPPDFRSISMAWGVEQLSPAEKFAKGVNAGIDQFGGTEDSASLLAALQKGLISEKQVDEAVLRILVAKFQLGLFENPYSDEAAAVALAGNSDFTMRGREAQSKAMVLLENKSNLLPLPLSKRVFLYGIDANSARQAGFTVADNPKQADAAIVRISTPHQLLHPGYFFGSRQNEGDLDFKDGDPGLQVIRTASANVPVIVAIYLDRPAILTNIVGYASAILANFGATDRALFDALTGRVAPKGRLPFELPRSMESVRKQRSDTPHDSGDPLYPIFSGKTYR
jgi:beta-glucosidase